MDEEKPLTLRPVTEKNKKNKKKNKNKNRNRKKNAFQRFWDWLKSIFPCLKKKNDYRIYGKDGYWTNQKCKPSLEFIEYPYIDP